MSDETAPGEFDPLHKDAKLMRWVMRQVAKEEDQTLRVRFHQTLASFMALGVGLATRM